MNKLAYQIGYLNKKAGIMDTLKAGLSNVGSSINSAQQNMSPALRNAALWGLLGGGGLGLYNYLTKDPEESGMSAFARGFVPGSIMGGLGGYGYSHLKPWVTAAGNIAGAGKDIINAPANAINAVSGSTPLSMLSNPLGTINSAKSMARSLAGR